MKNPVAKTIKSQYSCTYYKQRKSSVWYVDMVVEYAKDICIHGISESLLPPTPHPFLQIRMIF